MTQGNGVAQTWSYNNLLQMTNTQAGPSGSVFSLGNSYSSGSNNGNIVSQTVNGGTVNYEYDDLNRLKKTTFPGWGTEEYAYDRYGNRAAARTGGLPGLTGDTPNAVNWYNVKNRVNTFNYDGRGNLTWVPSRTMWYDGENRLSAMTTSGGVTEWFFYDGENRRVAKMSTSAGTLFVYDAFGQLAEEIGAPVTAGRQYYTEDHLGSTRAVTNTAGTVVASSNYLPFGEEIGGSGCATLTGGPKFTGQYRDQESCLDYFVNRYVSPAMGRFTSPDRPFADQHTGDPQSWNLYSYVRNNPLSYTDPTGMCSAGKDGRLHDDKPGDCGGGSITVTASPDVTVIDSSWAECFGPAAAYSMRCFGAYLEPGMVVNTDPGGHW